MRFFLDMGYKRREVTVDKFFPYRGEVFGAFRDESTAKWRVLHIRSGRHIGAPWKTRREAIEKALERMKLVPVDHFDKSIAESKTLNEISPYIYKKAGIFPPRH